MNEREKSSRTFEKLRKKRKHYTYDEVEHVARLFAAKLQGEPADRDWSSPEVFDDFVNENMWSDKFGRGEIN